jgi:hypothetical protein
VGPSGGLDAVARKNFHHCTCREWNTSRPVTILTELLRLQYSSEEVDLHRPTQHYSIPFGYEIRDTLVGKQGFRAVQGFDFQDRYNVIFTQLLVNFVTRRGRQN